MENTRKPKNKAYILLITTFILQFFSCHFAFSKNDYSAIIFTEILCSNEEILLDWKIKNTGSMPIKIWIGHLPWSTSVYGSARYQIFDSDKKPLETKQIYFGLPNLEEVKILPKNTISGKTFLSTIIVEPNLLKNPKMNDLTLKWIYVLKPEEMPERLYKGSIKIPQQECLNQELRP